VTIAEGSRKAGGDDNEIGTVPIRLAAVKRRCDKDLTQKVV